MCSAPLIEQALTSFFGSPLAQRRPSASPLRLVIAFSGGPDSTALLLFLQRLAHRLALELHAAHLDHGLDSDSRRRAGAARRLAERLGVPVTIERRPAMPLPGESPEAAGRRVRYAFLERRAEELGAAFIATAHHADDQAETVLLRLAFGSGVEGLAAIRPRSGRWVRPLLDLRRATLAEGLRELEPELLPVDDPTNLDLKVPRNRLRHHLLPRLEEREPGTTGRLRRLARRARHARRALDRRLEPLLSPRAVPGEAGASVDRGAFEDLPEALWPHALALLHRRAGATYPASAKARAELLRQLRRARGRGTRVGCDCGAGWRLVAASGKLQLLRGEYSAVDFSYTLGIPGVVAIPENGSRFHLRRGATAAWMFSRHPDRAGLAVPAGEETTIEIRNRRPGDRLVPLGHHRHRRLKKLLIDRRVPRRQRDRLPLLVIDGKIAWVPGIALGEQHRLRDSASQAWIARIEPL